MSDPDIFTWAVILSKPEYLDLALLGQALAAQHHMPLQDAAHLARQCWGIPGEMLSGKDAEGLIKNLEAVGLGGIIVPQDSLATVREPNVMDHIDFAENGLQLNVTATESRIVPWDFFSVAAVSIFKKNHVSAMKVVQGPSAAEQLAKAGLLLAGIPLPRSKRKTVEVKTESPELFYFLDLFLKHNGLRIRLNAQTMDYAFLKEKMVMGAHSNFRVFLSEIARNLYGALHNRGLRVLLQNQPVTTGGYQAASDLEKECRWLLTLAGTAHR